MTIRFLLTLVSLLFLLSAVIGQTQKEPPLQPQSSEVAATVAYARSIDQFTKRNPRRKRMFGNVAGEEDKQDKWREFENAQQLADENLSESVAVWQKGGKAVAAYFSFTSPSGDWSHYVTYYFRADGTLAKIHAQLNTFASTKGFLIVVREKFFSGGKLLSTSTGYLDPKSQKRRQREAFMDQPIPIYRHVRDLPFAKLL